MASTLSGLESSVASPVGTPKTLVYAASFVSKEALHHRTVDACQTIRHCPSISELTRRSMMRRVEACTESRGGHFEHVRRCTVSAVTNKLNVSGHMFI
jgi:hypothetical protein